MNTIIAIKKILDMNTQNELNIENMYLFRGISIESGGWVYGDLKNLSDGTRYVGRIFKVKVIPETVGQWTGLLDVNGVKIFEGDRVKISNFNGRFKYSEPDFDYRIFDIEWNTYTWAFNNDAIYAPLSTYDTNDLTEYNIVKIGTIHDNLLLKNNTEVTNGTNDSSGVSS
jgi:hypothetical protein